MKVLKKRNFDSNLLQNSAFEKKEYLIKLCFKLIDPLKLKVILEHQLHELELSLDLSEAN